MTTIPFPLEATGRLHHPTRRPSARRWRDGKLAAMAGVESLSRCRRTDLEVLAATADLVHVTAGTVLAEGHDLRSQWWMPLDGWLLAEGEATVARTVPAGWSWAAPRFPAARGRLTALRDSVVLVAPVQRLAATLVEHPQLDTAVRSTLVGGDV